jgi:hypothetical protein
MFGLFFYTFEFDLYSMKYACYFTLFTLILLSSCTKKQERMIAKSWEFEKIEKSVSGGPFIQEDLNCQNDDVWTFDKSGLFEINTGSNCSSSGIKGTWELSADEKTIAFTYDGFTGVYYDEIIELTKTTLVTIHDSGLQTPTYYKYYFKKVKK